MRLLGWFCSTCWIFHQGQHSHGESSLKGATACIFTAFPTSISDVATKIKLKGPVFCKYHVFFFPLWRKETLYKVVSLSPTPQLQTAHILWMGLLLGTAVPFFWDPTGWPGFLLSDKTTERRVRTIILKISVKKLPRVKNLNVLCSGSRIDKVGHFSLSNKDIIVLSEKCFVLFFLQDASFSPVLPFQNVEWLRLLIHGPKTKTSIIIHSTCVYKPHVFMSIGKLSWGCAPVKMFGLNLLSQNGQWKVFWSHPDQGLYGIIRFSRPECDFGFQRPRI